MISILFIAFAIMLIIYRTKNKDKIDSSTIKYDKKTSKLLLIIASFLTIVSILSFVLSAASGQESFSFFGITLVSFMTLKTLTVIFSIFFWIIFIDSISYLKTLVALGYELIEDRGKYKNKLDNVPHTIVSYDPSKNNKYSTIFAITNIIGAVFYSILVFMYYNKWHALNSVTADNFLVLLLPFLLLWIIPAVIDFRMRDNKKYKDPLDIKYLTDPTTGKDRKNRLSLSSMLIITTICLFISTYAIYLAHIVSYNMTYK